MSDTTPVPLPGSEAKLPEGAVLLGPVDPAERIVVGVALKPRTQPDPHRFAHWGQRRLTQWEAGALHGAHPGHIRRLVAFAEAFGLTTVSVHQPSRRVFLAGRADQIESAFGVTLIACQTSSGKTFRTYEGGILLPPEIAEHVIAVYNLETNPELWRRSAVRSDFTTPAGAFTVPQVAAIYNFPPGDGTGQVIGLIEPDGSWSSADMAAYFGNLGLPVPNIVNVPSPYDGTVPAYGAAPNADWEVTSDIQAAGAVCPKSTIVVYHGAGIPGALASGIFDHVNQPGVISVSWAAQEDLNGGSYSTDMSVTLAAAAAMGITVCCGSGDWGSAGLSETDGQAHIVKPAASPWALAVGATTLTASGTTITSETPWNRGTNNTTTGGVSRIEPLPSYQIGKGVPAQVNTGFAGRGVPDVCINGDPTTGYEMICASIGASPALSGGTSVAAPLWAGLIARMNQSLGKRLGFVNSLLYSLSAGFHDITSGMIGAYSAGAGWDACTGLGSPNGAVLLAAIQSAASPPVMPPIYGKQFFGGK